MKITINSVYFCIFQDCYSNKTISSSHCQNNTQIVLISTPNYYDYNTLLDDIFDRSDDDYRLCGAQACPITVSFVNQTLGDNGFRILPLKTADILIGVYAGACGAALILGCLGLDKIKLLIYQVIKFYRHLVE